jgi:peptidyl-prolyl isomerase E (cyclophilin E)
MDARRTLYVGHLAASVTSDTLLEAFCPFGTVSDIQMPTDATTKQHKGFAFVSFEEADDALHALDNMHHSMLCGVPITVNYATTSGS